MGHFSEQTPIVVGVEDSEAARRAADWASDEAAVHKRPLRLVRALDWPPGADRRPDMTSPWETWSGRFRAAGQKALDITRAQVLARHPDLTVDEELVDGTPDDVLRAAGRDAAMVALGSRRLSALREALTTGSIAVPVIAHAHCPVAVIRRHENTSAVPNTVVVGVDGSRASERALAYAFEEASLRGATVLALWVCHFPMTPVAAVAADAARLNARETLSSTLAGWTAKYPDVPVRQQIAFGHPVRTLADASRDALAVVVGQRGLGGFRGMLLGSVSQGLIHHAEAPLIVVPAGHDDA
ncbi:universal stress protein [Yinghuangia sp. YIM S09857]|uniref:universal stress protein n=1 Tax=Yinghuangia sp. YIM S09857 TaxID=3436929 RepID=UPI003F529D74